MITNPRLLVPTLCVLLLLACVATSQPAQDATVPGHGPSVPTDAGWPRTYEKGGQSVVIYQPQVDEWKDQEQIRFRAAIAVTPKDAKAPTYGVVAGVANTQVNADSRTVLLTDMQLDLRFPGEPQEKAATLEKIVRDLLPAKTSTVMSLDRVLACVKADAVKPAAVHVNLNPPPIHFSESPAILVVFVGPPKFQPVKDATLSFAVNTNWAIFQDQASSQYYLLDGDSWLTSPDVVKGPWRAAPSLPPALSQLPAEANWEDVRKHVPGQAAAIVPKVIVSTEPAELIVTQGEPRYTPIPGTNLSYVNNPAMPLFLDRANGSYYYLVAGRWFRTRNLLGGDWSAASAELPADFARIPPDSAMGYVLASVPGTEEAKDAILLASIPHKATISVNEAKVNVTYAGPPKFVPINGTAMQYAVNTPYDVIVANNQYYCCYQGVWFVAPMATGPWAVCTSVPAVIYTIPPTSPLYNVTYVRVYDTTPTTVTVGYTQGYSGAYVAATGVLMFGTGMLVGAALADNDNYYYHCGPAYYSYGCGAVYHYGYGSYYRGAAVYGPYGGAGRAAWYNPSTGTYSRGAYRYGPDGAAGAREAYNPYTNTYAAHAGATNGYQSWGRSAVSQDGRWATGGHESGPEGSVGWAQTSGGRAAVGAQGAGGGTAVKTSSGDVYAGKDGNVYRKSDGQWQHDENGSWQDVNRPNSSFSSNHDLQDQLNHDSSARDRGDFNASQSDSFRRGGFEGGGFRGGGFGGGRGGRR